MEDFSPNVFFSIFQADLIHPVNKLSWPEVNPGTHEQVRVCADALEPLHVTSPFMIAAPLIFFVTCKRTKDYTDDILNGMKPQSPI